MTGPFRHIQLEKRSAQETEIFDCTIEPRVWLGMDSPSSILPRFTDQSGCLLFHFLEGHSTSRGSVEMEHVTVYITLLAFLFWRTELIHLHQFPSYTYTYTHPKTHPQTYSHAYTQTHPHTYKYTHTHTSKLPSLDVLSAEMNVMRSGKWWSQKIPSNQSGVILGRFLWCVLALGSDVTKSSDSLCSNNAWCLKNLWNGVCCLVKGTTLISAFSNLSMTS